MELREAIEHCAEIIEQMGDCVCRNEHEELKEFLEELQKYRDTGLTTEQIRELKERDTAKEPIITGYNHAVGCKVGECPKCGTMSRDYMNFCNECGQRLKWEEK